MRRGERGNQPMPGVARDNDAARLTVRPVVKAYLSVVHGVALLAGAIGCTAGMTLRTIRIET